MKTLKRLVITPHEINQTLLDEQMAVSEACAIPNQLRVETEFAQFEDILDELVLESDADIDEKWLKEYINKLNYHWVHLDLNDFEWKKAGIRPTLYGQSRLVGGQVISYGRWGERSRYQNSQRYESPVSEMAEATIGTWHEGTHGFADLFDMGGKGTSAFAWTHYHFYGYAKLLTKAQERKDKPKRWQRTPTPVLGWRSMPWGRLPEIDTREPIPVRDYGLNIEQKLLDDKYTDGVPQWWEGNTPKSIILHTTLGDDSGLGSWAWLDQIELSYHFIVAADGKIYQLVPFGKSSWHAGVTKDGAGNSLMTQRAVEFFGAINPNKQSIGIAFARNGHQSLTPAQAAAGIGLLKYIGQHTGVMYTAANVFAHCETYTVKPKEVLNYRLQVLDGLAGDREPSPELPPAVPIHAPQPAPQLPANTFEAFDTAVLMQLVLGIIAELQRRALLDKN